jgi:hypothetical protein
MRIKQYLLVTLGFGLAGAIGGAFGTGTAQAVVASLVEVVNPGTSPVHTSSVDDPGRIPYRVTIDMSTQCNGGDVCLFVSPVVPAGHRVVVEHVSSRTGADTTSAPAIVDVYAGDQTTPIVTSFYISSGAAGIAFDQPVLLYIDSSNSVTILIGFVGAHFSSLVNLTLIGYELDCTVAACAPIATQ